MVYAKEVLNHNFQWSFAIEAQKLLALTLEEFSKKEVSNSELEKISNFKFKTCLSIKKFNTLPMKATPILRGYQLRSKSCEVHAIKWAQMAQVNLNPCFLFLAGERYEVTEEK